MKIAIFTPYNIFIHGGVNDHVNYQAKLLRARGHDVTIITPRPRKNNDPAPEGVVYLGGSARVKAPHATSADISVSIDNEDIDAELSKGYDILHVHEPLVPIAARQLLSRAEGSTLRIGTFHAALPGNALGKSLVSTYRSYAKRVLPHIDVVTAVTPAATGFIEGYDIPITYIPNGIDLTVYKPRNVERDRNMVLFIGRLEKRKGVKEALKAFELLKQRKPEIKLVIGSDGPLRESLEEYVAENDIADVEFLGFISDEEKLDLLSRCGVFTSPALYGESFGIVLAEAMAMSAPIVAHPNNGYRWVLRETGRLSLVNCEDTEAYASRIELLLEDDDLRSVWQNWAKDYVCQFDYNNIVDQYEALYTKHLASNR